ncbi:MAG: hypothetical protein Q8O31_04745, partial [Rhodocyclaceae bacterium]|nr:hypothetical protein [Rhodocyclaceae bacterium]
SLHFYPIPSPALPLKGREIGTALPLKGREAATTASITHYKPYRAQKMKATTGKGGDELKIRAGFTAYYQSLVVTAQVVITY